ncbi:MAG TPA: hypothetical protein VGG60_11770 [Candidatus Binataceae bacterium]
MRARERSRQRAMSLLRYAPGLVVLVIVIADSGQMTDTDLWGHIRFGQAVIAQRHLILRDPYSYSAFGHRWDNHEWLTEVVMAASYNAFGVVGLKLWKLACVAATMLLVAMGLAETGATPTVQLNTFTVVAVATMPQMEFRPQLFTFLLVAAMLALLARHNYRGAAPLWLLIPMMALWANLHGGFIVGIAILALYTAVAAIDDLISSAGFRRGLGLGALTIAALASTMITPYGRDTWRPVLRALRNPMTRIAVTDWQPLGFAMMRQWQAHPAGVIYILCGIGMLLAFVAAFALVPRGGDLPLVAIAGVLSIAAITAVRNLPIAVIACALPVARHSWLLILRRRERISEETAKAVPQTERSAASPWLALVVAVMLAIYSGIFSSRLRVDKPYPERAIAFMQKHDLRGNILGDFDWGEYLIWHTAPGSKVFIDGRYDTVYPYSVIEQYIDFYFDRGGAQSVLTAYPHDLILIPPASGAFELMQRQPGWKLIYHDADAALFARANAPAARISGVPVTGVSPPVTYFP